MFTLLQAFVRQPEAASMVPRLRTSKVNNDNDYSKQAFSNYLQISERVSSVGATLFSARVRVEYKKDLERTLNLLLKTNDHKWYNFIKLTWFTAPEYII